VTNLWRRKRRAWIAAAAALVVCGVGASLLSETPETPSAEIADQATSPRAATDDATDAATIAAAPVESRPFTEEEAVAASRSAEDGPPLGRLEILFSDAEGEGVEGVETDVLEASSRRVLARAVSSKEGLVGFDLAPGTYRWARRSGPLVDVVPAHEDSERWLELDRGAGFGWRRTGGAPSLDVSGVVEVFSSRTTTITARAYSAGSIVGRLPVGGVRRSGEFAKSSVVYLFRRSTERSSRGPNFDLRTDEEVDRRDVGVDGAFEFKGLRPGDYVLQADWFDVDSIYFSRTIVAVVEGPATNVGLLSASGGATTLIVGASDHGGRMLRVPPGSTAEVRMVNADPGARDVDDMNVVFVAPADRPIRLVGLSEATWKFSFVEPPAWAKELGATEPPRNDAHGRPGGAVRLEMRAPAPKVDVVVRLRAAESPRLFVTLLSKDGAARFEAAAHESGWSRGECLVPMKAPAGRYRLIAHGQRTTAEGGPGDREATRFASRPPPSALQAVRDVSISETDATVDVDLAPGATFDGLLLDASGRPAAKKRVLMGPRGADAWIYDATTDERGRFRFVGLSEGVDYEFLGAEGRPTLYGSGEIRLKRN
jgi:hypothetical protein